MLARLGRAMYVYITMRRTQIYLTEDEAAVLDRIARASGQTRSQLIRDAIRRTYLARRAPAEILQALGESAGGWRHRVTGAAYVERMRSGRLARLHGTSE